MSTFVPPPTPATRFLAALDRLRDEIVNLHANLVPEFFIFKPEVSSGPEILDENGQSFDPPRFTEVTDMVPDIPAIRAAFEGLGDKAAAMTILHAIACAFANSITRVATGHVDMEVLQFAVAGIAVRDAGLIPSIDNTPPVGLVPNFVTGEVDIIPL
jgi:hypothetical protein